MNKAAASIALALILGPLYPQESARAVLMVRQSLAADSLQAREGAGGNIYEIQSSVTAPRRLRLAKRGDLFYISVAAEGEPLHFSGGAVQAAVFSNVDLKVSSGPESRARELYSTIESVPVPAGDRRVTYAAPGRITGPVWTRDGASIVFCLGDAAEQVPASGGAARATDAGSPRHCPENAVSENRESSPDGRHLAFVSYQTLPLTRRYRNASNYTCAGPAGTGVLLCFRPNRRRPDRI